MSIFDLWTQLTCNLKLLLKIKQTKTIHYPTLPATAAAKTLCSSPSTLLQGFRNYTATILKSYLRGMSIISLALLCAVHRSVLYVMLCAVSSICSVVFLFTHCRRHSASVFHCEDLFLHWSSSFMGVNCRIHTIFYGANYSSHHVSSFLTGANCLSHPIYFMVLTVQATMLLAFSQVLMV